MKMVFTVRSGRCKSLPHTDNALVSQDYPDTSSQTKLVKSNSIRSQQFLNHVGLYHYRHWPDLQNTTFFTYFFGEKHTHCVVLTQTFDDTTSTWVLYEGGSDESAGREAFNRINRTLAPLLYEGAVILSEDLLDAIITPEPVPPEDVPDIVLEMIEINPCGHPEWPLVVKALLLAEEKPSQAGVDSTDAVTPVATNGINVLSPSPEAEPGKPTNFERLTSIASVMASDSNDDVFYSLKSPQHVSEVVDLHDAAKADKSEFIRKAMVRKATQGGFYDDLPQDSLECSLTALIEEGNANGSVDFDLVDRISQDTPLYSSVEKGYIKSSLYFLLGGANPSFVHPESGDTCLHLATRQGSPDMVKLLLSFNADPLARNNNGETPLDVLKDSEQCKAIRSLLEEVARLRRHNESLPCEPIAASSKGGGIEGEYLLSFDGGGSRCVTAVQTLIAVEKHMHKINPNCKPFISHFDYVAGTSGGAFLSTMLVYNRSTLENARALNVNGATFLSPGSIYEKSKNVEKLIKSTLGSDRVMADVTYPRCILTATLANTIPPKLHLLTNYGEPRNNQPGPEEQTIWEAARMSSAAPTYLLSYKNIIDGGVMANNPTVDAIVDMNEQAKKETGKPLKLGCVLSLGCGVEQPVDVENIDVSGYSFGIQGLANKVDGFKNLISLMISSVTQTEGQDLSRAKTLCDLSGGVYYRLTPPVDQAIPLDTCNPVELIQPIFDSFMYTLRNPDLVDSVARTLLSKSNLY